MRVNLDITLNEVLYLICGQFTYVKCGDNFPIEYKDKKFFYAELFIRLEKTNNELLNRYVDKITIDPNIFLNTNVGPLSVLIINLREDSKCEDTLTSIPIKSDN